MRTCQPTGPLKIQQTVATVKKLLVIETYGTLIWPQIVESLI